MDIEIKKIQELLIKEAKETDSVPVLRLIGRIYDLLYKTVDDYNKGMEAQYGKV